MFRIAVLLMTAALLAGSFTETCAQVHPGLRVGFSRYVGSPVNMLLVGTQLDIERSENVGYRVSFDYGRGAVKNESYSAFARSSAANPSSITVTGDTRVRTFHLALDGRRFLGSGNYEDAGVYGFLGIGFTLANSQSTYDFGVYDKSVYSVTGQTEEEEPQWFSQYMLRGGLGYAHKVGNATVFVEAKLNMPANNLNDAAIPIDIGPNVGLWMGIRF